MGSGAVAVLAGRFSSWGAEEPGRRPRRNAAAGEAVSEAARGDEAGGGASERRSGPPGPIPVDSFSAVVSGARDTTYEGSTAAGDVEAATNCILERPARISFTTSPGDEPSASRFRAITGSVINPGQTGTFRADSISYRHPRFGIASETTYVGPGMLEITAHDAWWGFEFDYANAHPDESVACIWTRSQSVNDGNYEGVNKSNVATDTVDFKLDAPSGHAFFPGYDTFPANFTHPWYMVDMEYDCTYPKQGRLFVADYRLIFSNVFK
jgi:hypothetical protein